MRRKQPCEYMGNRIQAEGTAMTKPLRWKKPHRFKGQKEASLTGWWWPAQGKWWWLWWRITGNGLRSKDWGPLRNMILHLDCILFTKRSHRGVLSKREIRSDLLWEKQTFLEDLSFSRRDRGTQRCSLSPTYVGGLWEHLGEELSYLMSLQSWFGQRE